MHLLVIPNGDLLLLLLMSLFVFNVVILSEAKDPCICLSLFILGGAYRVLFHLR
jgi:hypothetical protein